jgi:hypothetical protein
LSREHKFKKTDLELLYGKSAFANNSMGLIRFQKSSKPIPLRSTRSKFIKFDPSLCKECNNARSAEFDKAQAKVIEYYLQNEDLIKEQGFIDFQEIFNDAWDLELENFYKYFVKHVSSRLVDSGIEPSKNIIAYLNGEEDLMDIKFVFQIKPYKIGDEPNSIDHIYMGPLNIFAQKHLFMGQKITCVSGWYTIKQFSINYVHRKHLLRPGYCKTEGSKLVLEIVSYSQLVGVKHTLTPDGFDDDYADLMHRLEYHPFVGPNRASDHYDYIVEKEMPDNRLR